MRESNYSFPPHNRAVLSITHMLYDRRALDTNSPLAILNNLTSLTYLTSTSPRIREILTLDGGLERLLDILRSSCLPRESINIPDVWGLNGPPTSRVINVDRQVFLRHSLAFQCVVNIGVRGSEAIRTRVVQAGALDLVAQILESWLTQHGVSIFAGAIGSQAAVDAIAAGMPIPGTEHRRRVSRASRIAAVGGTARASLQNFVANFSARSRTNTDDASSARSDSRTGARDDTDVDMADAEGEEGTDGASVGAGDDSMEVDDRSETTGRSETVSNAAPAAEAGPSMTPRATASLAPYSASSRSTSRDRNDPSQASSIANSVSGDEAAGGALPRATSDNNLGVTAGGSRPAHLHLNASRMPQLGQDSISNQSSPMATPVRQEANETARAPGRRGTLVGRPVNLAPRNERRRDPGGSGTSDGGEDVDLPTATIAAGIAAANAQAMEGGGTIVPDEPGPPPNVEIVENLAGALPEDPDPEQVAAEQARLDMEAGAPPGQPGAAQTPRVPTVEAGTPQQLLNQPPDPATVPNAQIIIANGAPRGFQDLGSYVGVASMLNPEGDRYSDDSILLALQLLAYLSKYPHVRSAFHHPRRPMHPTFDLKSDKTNLPERPAMSHTPNMFSLVERFTFRPSPSDPTLHPIPRDVQYWAGVIMRNACRKDENNGGIRQCAHMTCGKWEEFPRQFAKCRRCRKAKYCSKECQSRAWSEGHRFWCNTRSDDPPPGVAGAPGGGPPSRDPGGDDDDMDMDFGNADLPEDIVARLRAARAVIQGGAGAPAGTGGEGGRRNAADATGPSHLDQLPADLQQTLLDEVVRGTRDRTNATGMPHGGHRARQATGEVVGAQNMSASDTLRPTDVRQWQRSRGATTDATTGLLQ